MRESWETTEGIDNMVNGTFPISLVFTGATDQIQQDFVMKTVTLIGDYLACKEPNFSISDFVHGVLDAISFIPIAGDIADFANALVYTIEGDNVAASASLAAVVFGSSGAVVPVAKKIAGEITEEVEEKIIKEVSQGTDLPVTGGRAGKQEKLRETMNDDKASSADRGWIKQEVNQIKRGKRKNIRNPPGKDLAHERGREAAKGYSYKYSKLNDRKLHRLQHKYDKNGKLNKERKP